MARVFTLTDQMRDAICEAISVGAPQKDAALAAGVNPGTLREWLRMGRKEGAREELRRLVAEVELARGRRIKALLSRVYLAASKPQHWQAAAWLLTAIDPQTYGRHAAEVRALRAELAEVRGMVEKLTGT